MTSRAQDAEIDRLHDLYGALAVRDGFLDHHVDVTAEGGKCFRVTEEGHSTETHPNHSIRWQEDA